MTRSKRASAFTEPYVNPVRAALEEAGYQPEPPPIDYSRSKAAMERLERASEALRRMPAPKPKDV